ncbi:hypothetical protein VF21_06396 [Pseudogymnoascus sp. 05NY08]|nr:hypothetical protein VF21_06396 [Pseudogymnoascus sp. 05NY08]
MDRFRRRSSASVASVDSSDNLGQAVIGALRRISPARKATTQLDEDPESPEDVKGALGLNLLHAVQEPLIDFIFVHGLGGGSRKTWSMSPDSKHYWPKEWLPQDPDFRYVRIHSFGYKADWDDRKESILSIHDFARSLLGEVQYSPDIRRSNTKIVFIAHSMGGIVIKKAYLLAREDPDLRDLALRIHSLYFLATPHRGSHLAKTLSNILQVSFGPVSYGPKPFLGELNRTSETIISINDSFRHFSEDLQLWSFYETVPSNLVRMKILIVDKSSATLGYAREQSLLLNADHRGVCKFDRQSDPNYQTLRKSFITTIDSILSEVSQTESDVSKFQRQQLTKLTGVSEPPIDELCSLEDVRVPGSGQWLVSNEVYVSWQTEHAAKRRIFCLTAKPGSGKSVLSGHVINNLQEQKLSCCYYFFRHRNATKSKISGCLRSLAYQMASSNNSILERLCEVQQESTSWEQWDEKMIWRKLFLGCIFKERSSVLQFWVIDALDECQMLPLFLSLLADVPQHVRIFITARKTPELDNGLVKIANFTEHYQIKGVDTLSDLRVFIDSKMDILPASDDDGRENLKQRILAKASGSFLWVSLVVKELEQAYSEEGAEEILNDLSTDMNEFYARMLESIFDKNPRAATLARTIFVWSLLSLRPLKVDEIQLAVKLDISQTVHNLEKSIQAICGQLLQVNQKNEVEAIHQTARAFLLQQDNCPNLTLSEPDSHTRIAQICLKILAGDMHQALQRSSKMVSFTTTPETKLIDYACEYFSDHLRRCSSEDPMVWDALFKFLESNLLSWIEYLARNGKLYHITRTAKNLQTYLRRRVKYLSPLSQQKTKLETWINDLIRLSAKFGANLDISPSSIHEIISAMCPQDSLVSKTYSYCQPGLRIKGLIDKAWDDCLIRIDFPAHQTSAVAYGEQYAAVSLSDSTIFLYYKESTRPKSTLSHGERAKMLIFSSEDKYMVSGGIRKLKVWNPEEGTQVFSFDTNHQAITLLFIDNNSALVAATQGNYTITWDLLDGSEKERWQWTDSIHITASTQRPRQQPGKALLSPDYTTLAVSYRGLPLYLFNIRSRKFIGCCSREPTSPGSSGTMASSHYIVDALAFNPSLEINNLVVSYGDGELAVYDRQSTELRSLCPGVFAHNLTCSPNGRTIVAGSSRGTIQIFEFAGARGETLSLIYRIHAYEDGIQGIAFSSDGLCFADIRGSQYRVWQPVVLVYNNLDEGSQSELSHGIPLEPVSVSMLESPLEAEVTAMCSHPDGNFVFCGKQDGSITYFETKTAAQRGILYCHARKIIITCITYVEKQSLLITGDESGRVLINNITVSRTECEMVAQIAEIRVEKSLIRLLGEPLGSRVLIQSKTSAEVWTTMGEKIGPLINYEGDSNSAIFNHPLCADNFVSINNQGMRIYSWASSLESELLVDENLRALSFTVTPPSPALKRALHFEDWVDDQKHQQHSQFVAHLHKNSTISTSCPASASLKIWPASSVSTSDAYLSAISIPSFDKHSDRIQQIIATAGSLVFFLDTDLWVCSLDVAKTTTSSHEAMRHFFLLSEWQSSDRGFIIEYMPSRREFIIAMKHCILVFSRGLEFEEPWFS